MSAAKWTHILVAVRAPEQTRQMAVKKAGEIAKRCGAKVTLFHTFSMPYPLPSRVPFNRKEVLKMVCDERRKLLEKIASPLRATGVRVKCEVVWDFPPGDAVVRHVLSHKPDLLIAESHRHTRIGRWFLANTDWELIRECPCPVWFVKHDRLPKTPQFLVAVDPTHARAKPTRLDDRLLTATALAVAQTGGRVAVVHAEDVMQVLPRGFMAEVMIPEAAIAAAEKARTVVRAGIRRMLKRHDLSTAVEIVQPGLPADVIIEAGRSLKADVLVMGVVSRRELTRSLVGNTAEKVIDAASADILVVKQAGFRTAVPRRVATP